MEFLLLRHRRSSAQKIPSSEGWGETAVFTGYWFHCEMTTEEAAQKFHTDDVLPLRSASDWMKQICNQSEALPYLGNNMSLCGETSEWQHVHQMSAILSGYASFTGQLKPELHPDWSSSSWFNSNFLTSTHISFICEFPLPPPHPQHHLYGQCGSRSACLCLTKVPIFSNWETITKILSW